MSLALRHQFGWLDSFRTLLQEFYARMLVHVVQTGVSWRKIAITLTTLVLSEIAC
jgi:hypothetical protein